MEKRMHFFTRKDPPTMKKSRFDISSAGLHILGMVIMLMDHT